MRLKDILCETTTIRLTTRGGSPFTVYKNPNKTTFDNLTKKYKSLRGLITSDEQTLYLWDSLAAIHRYVIQDLGLQDVQHIYYWGYVAWEDAWTDYKGMPILDDSGHGYKAAIQRLSPYKSEPIKNWKSDKNFQVAISER